MNRFKSMRILITGIQGLIGWNLYNALKADYEVFGFSKTSGDSEGEWYDGLIEDFRRVKEVIEKVNPHVIIHAQAMCNLDLCEVVPDKTFLVNVEATRLLLDAVDPSRHFLVYVSSEHVFSGEQGGYREEDVRDPITVYGKSRVEAEDLVRSRFEKHLIVRPGLVIAPSLQGNIGPHDFLKSRMLKGKPMTYFTDEIRSPILFEDFYRGFELLLKRRAVGIFHLGGKRGLSRYQIAGKLLKYWDLTGTVIPRSRHEDKTVPRIGDCTLDSSKAEAVGWRSGPCSLFG